MTNLIRLKKTTPPVHHHSLWWFDVHLSALRGCLKIGCMDDKRLMMAGKNLLMRTSIHI